MRRKKAHNERQCENSDKVDAKTQNIKSSCCFHHSFCRSYCSACVREIDRERESMLRTQHCGANATLNVECIYAIALISLFLISLSCPISQVYF